MKRTAFLFWLISAYVLIVYATYPSGYFLSVSPNSLYQFLTEGFLSGHMNILLAPPPELLNLPDPYDHTQNINLGFLWDASLFKGKYYLYFGPLPVIAFYLPFKLLTGFYPSDAMAVFFFLSLGFLVSFFLMIKIKNEYFPRISNLQLLFVGFLLGFANGTPDLFAVTLVYQAAISSAFCLVSFALYFLYELVNNRSKIKNTALFSLCLSLSVAGRPHFALLCVFLIPGVLLYLLKQKSDSTGNSRAALVSALLLPCISIGVILGWYNYLRFGSIFDFGHVWQLTAIDGRDFHNELSQIAKLPRNVMFGFYFYFLQPYNVSLTFPYVVLHHHFASIPIDRDYFYETIAGVFTTAPFILMVLGLPKLIMIHWKTHTRETPLCWFLLFVLFIPFILILFLISLPIATQRYEVDFLPWLVMLSVIAFWLLEGYAGHLKGFKGVKAVFFITGIYSVYIGWALAVAENS